MDDIEVFDIGNSTFVFSKKAEVFLGIKINGTDSFDDIVNHGLSGDNRIAYDDSDINQELIHLFLDGFNRDEIRLYRPQDHKDMPKSSHVFLYKLSLVVNNNYQMIEPRHVEDYIHDLMDNVLREAKFEDGTELILMPGLLNLHIGNEAFAARSDKEGRRGTGIIWVIDEDKHKFDTRWKRGDIQLIANMIAAAQTNRLTLDTPATQGMYPDRMLGIKFDADRLYFYSAYIDDGYLNELMSGDRPASTITVNKYPKSRELSLSVCSDRKEIFLCFSALRKYALGIEPVYADA